MLNKFTGKQYSFILFIFMFISFYYSAVKQLIAYKILFFFTVCILCIFIMCIYKYKHMHVCIYIYAFSRRFYPKPLTVLGSG